MPISTRIRHALLATSLISSQALCAASAPNIILIIGDGMDDQHVSIGRNYLHGAAGETILDTMPVRAAVSVLTVDNDDPQRAIYVADSANTASAIATGVTTSKGRISTTAHTNQATTTIMEQAHAAGIKTGIVTTASVTDATPAAFMSHARHRGCQGPKDMQQGAEYYGNKLTCWEDAQSKGGWGSIAEQLANAPLDVLLGGGNKYFQQHSEGSNQSLYEVAEKNGYTVNRSRGELLNYDGSRRLLGIFAKNHLPVIWQGPAGQKATKVTSDGKIKHLEKAFACEDNPNFGDTPSLAEMTSAALRNLQQSDKGFILMVESASIDKQSHARNPCGHIGEFKQLEETTQVALDFAKDHPNTLVMITADHGHAAQIVPAITATEVQASVPTSPGLLAHVITPEGSIMGINYATNDSEYSESHTGVNVPLYANEVGKGLLPPHLKQAELNRVMREFLGL